MSSEFVGEEVVKKDVVVEWPASSEEMIIKSGKDNLTLQAQLSPSTPSPSSTGKSKKKSKESHDGFYCQFRKMREKPSLSKSMHAVPDHAGKSMSSKRQKPPTSVLHSPLEVKTPTMIRAEEIQLSLGSEFPCFAKSMIRSHVSSCFWMRLPVPFCKKHLPVQDTTIILEDESREQFEVKFIAIRAALSGGWRNFAVGHKLLEGDVMIFQLVEPNKFKVYIVRANYLTEVDGALGLINLDAHTKQNETKKDDAENGEIAIDNKRGKRPASLPAVVKKKKKTAQPKSVPKPTQSAKQLENDSEEVGSEVLVGPRFSAAPIRIRDVKSFEDFHILVDGSCIDSEIPEHVRVKYYELCCSRKTLIHARLLRGLNVKLAAGTISETVNIASAIRACKLTTPCDEFSIWEQTLKSFELMGMNVGFLRARLRCLLSLAVKSEVDMDTRRYVEAKTGKVKADDEIRNLEAKVVQLKEASEKFGADIEALKGKAESYEHKFQEAVNAPW